MEPNQNEYEFKTVNAAYKASTEKKSTIKMSTPMLDLELHQMIVWVMHNQQDAMQLLPEYRKIKVKLTPR